MAGRSLRDEPSIEELIEARDRTDAGLRLALPQLFDDVEPQKAEAPASIDHETAKEIGNDLLEVQGAVSRIALALPLKGHMDIHLALNGMGNEVDRLLALVSERWGA
jgi:hypothetical protein